ncbi:hypothetical protein CEXT_123701 [Caerostris extrusa]|uniref:Uncharacterized protein n=1 Tax=Caerostris extrusa TaxID=172846 RepID=A0AAV4UYW9_CAEEX|nr:hypothetical protein CEXT_123701 [Caerostris extrusa]
MLTDNRIQISPVSMEHSVKDSSLPFLYSILLLLSRKVEEWEARIWHSKLRFSNCVSDNHYHLIVPKLHTIDSMDCEAIHTFLAFGEMAPVIPCDQRPHKSSVLRFFIVTGENNKEFGLNWEKIYHPY